MTMVLTALAPALAVLWYYYHRARRPEAWRRVLLLFALGAAAAIVALPIERFVQSHLPLATAGGPPTLVLLECLLIPGLIEETLKLAAVLVFAGVLAAAACAPSHGRRPAKAPLPSPLLPNGRGEYAVNVLPDGSHDRLDGLIYGTAAALGFTFAEDCRYHWLHGGDWTRVLSTVAHPWFSCFWAASLGWAKRLPRLHGVALVLLGLAASVVVHALFDFFILAGQYNADWAWLRHLLPPLLICLYFAVERMLESAPPLPPGSEPVAASFK